MSDNYKNILANAYMRDTNYIIIKDTDDIEDLEQQWNNFLSLMTPRQQRLSDDKSIEIWNKTNQQHYEDIKTKLEKKTSSLAGNDNNRNKIKTDKFSDDIEPHLINPIKDDVTGYEDHTFDTIELPDTVTLDESDRINLVEPKDQYPETADDYAKMYDQTSNYNIIAGLNGNTAGEKLEDLEKQYNEFRSQSNEIMRKSDDVSRQLYGISNQERYNKLKSELLNSADETTVEKSPLGENSFVIQCAENRYRKKLNESSKRRDALFVDTPYFTPEEMIDLGVYGNNNKYSDHPDNDKLVGYISIPLWFDSYKDMCKDHVFEDYRKEWVATMRKLYSDYDKIKESGDQERILARKQSILELGWNPEIDYEFNRKYASSRIKCIIQANYPVDHFIKLDSIPELSEEELNEAVDDTYEPVFLVLTKGKTPVISQGIKFVTKSEYSHASITFDPELNEVYSFNMRKNNWGFIKENLSSFKDNVISVFAFFAEKPVVTKLKKTVYDFANHKTNFDLRIFANKIFHINHKASNDQYQQVCSTFVDTVLKSGDINLVGDQQIPAPSDIYNGAKTRPNKIFEVYYGIAPKYNGAKVKRQISFLKKNKDTLSINESVYDENILEALQDLKNGVNPFSNKTFYHISFDDNLDDKVLKPRIPSWITREMKKDKDFAKKMDTIKTTGKDVYGTGYEEYKTPRVCLSNSIEGCLNAIINDNDRMTLAGKQIYVYIPEKPISQYKTKMNKAIQKDGDIFDSNITNEMWILEPVKMKYVGSIVVDKVTTEKKTKFANDKKKTLIKYIYKWHWFHKLKYGKPKYEDDKKKKSKNESFEYFAEDRKGYTLKPATEDDVSILYKWKYDTIVKYAPKNNPQLLEDINFYCSRETRAQLSKYQVIYVGKDKAGSLLVYPKNDAKFIDEIYITNKHRGKGIGTDIIKTLQSNNDKLVLNVYKKNTSAISLYERLGFVLSKDIDEDRQEMTWYKSDNKVSESFTFVNEQKKFPVEFDEDGNLIIYKCRMGNIDYGDEIDKTAQLLEAYRNATDLEGIKYELARLWFLIDSIEKEMTKKNIKKERYDELVRNRAMAKNIFTQNFSNLTKYDKTFNFAEYYHNTPFSDHSVKITHNTLKYSAKALLNFLK